MQLPIKNLKGEAAGQVEASDYVFGVAPHRAVLHQALVAGWANARQGNVNTKTRGEVEGSTRKLYAQKHTGRARRGSIRSPLLRHGGIAFGPKPRDFTQALPKKMRRLAIRSALSAHAAEGTLTVVEGWALGEAKARSVAQALKALGAGKSALLATAGVDKVLVRCARNLPGVRTTPADQLNTRDLLAHESLIMTVDAVRRCEALWGAPAGSIRKPTSGGAVPPLPGRQPRGRRGVPAAPVGEE